MRLPDWRSLVRSRLPGEGLSVPDGEDLVEELAQHLEAAYAELRAEGVSATDAEAQLVAQLDTRTLLELAQLRSTAAATPFPPIGMRPSRPSLRGLVAGDLRYALRTVARAPLVSSVIVLSLAIVIGVNTAIFGLMDAIVLRRLPLPNAEQLVAVAPTHEGEISPITYSQFDYLRTVPDVPRLEAFRIEPAVARVGDATVDVWADMVSGGYLDLLGAQPLVGRSLSRQDEADRAPVVVVSEDFWRQHLAADSAIVGAILHLGDVAATVVGVLPRSFAGIHFARRFALAMPITLSPGGYPNVTALRVTMIARRQREGGEEFAPLDRALPACCVGAAMQGAAARADAVRVPRSLPPDPPTADMASAERIPGLAHVAMVDISRGLTWSTDFRGRYRVPLFALAAAGAVLLLVACTNVATLLLSRAAARQRDFAIRLAVGANRRRIAVQLFLETLLLAGAAALLAIAVSALLARTLPHFVPPNASPLREVIAWRPDAGIFAFTSLVSLLCAVLIGLWPARIASRADVLSALTGARRASGARWRGGAAMVGAQITLTLVLVVLGALFASTVRELTRSEGGYHTRRVVVARINAAPWRDGIPGMHARYDRILAAVSALPDVEGSALAWSAPIIRHAMSQTTFAIPGRESQLEWPTVRTNFVTPGYFGITGVGLLAGREFSDADRAGGEPVVIVSEALARRHFAGSATGATMLLPDGPVRVVGVARGARYDKLAGEATLREWDEELMYFPVSQAIGRRPLLTSMMLVVRPRNEAAAVVPAVRQAIAAEAPDYRLGAFLTVGDMLDNRTAPERFMAAVITAFAALALLLSAAGVFGVTSYQVARRTREMGVRIALGATSGEVVWLVLRRVVVVASVATALGILGALGAGRAVRAQLFGVSAGDPLILLGAAVSLVGVAVLAGLLPGVRAATVDPVVALREE